jgi:hypothetical protein
VYLFHRVDDVWGTPFYLKARFPASWDLFGESLALSSNGNVLAVGARGDDGGVVGDELDESAAGAGAVYVFERTSLVWAQHSYLKVASPVSGDGFGMSVAMSAEGDDIVVGASSKNDLTGAAYIFRRDSITWSEVAFLEAFNAGPVDSFGMSEGISNDGRSVIVGAERDDSAAVGVGGDHTDDSASGAGAIHVFAGAPWSQVAYVKASNPSALDYYGISAAMAGDGRTFAVGAMAESSSGTGINGPAQGDNNTISSGAVYVHRL